jgi:uncharacterized protein YbbK (DUF523 family)
MKCTWSGDDEYKSDRAIELSKTETLIPICPEQLGGLPTPRVPQEIQGGAGEDVLNGKCKVLNKDGEDVTKGFIKGAQEALRIAEQFNIGEFIGKSKSPSCGCGQVYDGTFSGKLTDGDGIATALLRRNGIRIIPEENL